MRLMVLATVVLLLLETSVPSRADAGEPCCGVVAIDARTGVVTARDLTSTRSFQFVVTDRVQLRSLAVGQKIWADFGAKQVRIHEAEPCCTMTNVRVGR